MKIGSNVIVIRPEGEHRRFRGATGRVVRDTGPCVWVRFEIPSRWSNRTYQWFRKEEVAVMKLRDEPPKSKGPSTYLNGLDALVAMDKAINGRPSGFPDHLEISLDPKVVFTVRTVSEMGKEPRMKQSRYITAWKIGPEFTATGDNHFTSQLDADKHANKLAEGTPGSTVVVLKCVSQHSSQVRVTTEAL
ncbi:hypothetical protein JQ617_08205 [Bradyrhizobium sp. KB893862 SZCCT0404]|uniref:hypothetical protein n=1 Tax=Bradyrhizobium sp. KB893862 SZCCT0404 TaxID=2807672 RepID=UPI001BA714C7|nr:hypothetical protein [Bradyrhizobium sp. KB893862 SZCCT0404]MBR1173932.1 hypothetical protein [Bradyrhizobium sp. KB893862 SZCCT0404]